MAFEEGYCFQETECWVFKAFNIISFFVIYHHHKTIGYECIHSHLYLSR